MLSVSSTSQSAMSAAQNSMELSASQVAAAASVSNSPRQRVPEAERAEGEASVKQANAAEAGPSMETDLVGMLQEKNSFLANLAVFRNSERMTGGLISLNS